MSKMELKAHRLAQLIMRPQTMKSRRQSAEARVVRAAMQSFDEHVKQKGSAQIVLETSWTAHGRALVRACARLAARREGGSSG